MLSPRGGFACAVVSARGSIYVAGEGLRHTMFEVVGSRIRSVEQYEVGRDQWVPMENLPGFRAECVGFVEEEGREFWVMGGYGESKTISGVFSMDEYYKDAVVMGVESGAWREVGDMGGNGERVRVGKIVVVEYNGCPMIFMLDGNEILRYFL
ncbi:hypothetical protein AAZX31_11G163700 [Glycine max]|nr:hypothetical protein GYH30_031158 [Glycine max]